MGSKKKQNPTKSNKNPTKTQNKTLNLILNYIHFELILTEL